MAVSDVWMSAAVLTPRTLIQVRTRIDASASSRCHDRPTSMDPLGNSTRTPTNTSGDSAGHQTAVKRPKATATAAMVPVWITRKKVQP